MKKIKLSEIYYYEPKEPLGKAGGFGQVFRGKSSSGEEVAIKRLHLSAADAAHRELRVADELKGKKQKHVLQILDAGEDSESGEYFIAMVRADRTLASVVEERGPLPVEEAAAIMLQIAIGLEEVGELVHRDLKPENILLQDGLWKIADFGIARFFEEATSQNTVKDFLSPLFAAPEQWRFEKATHATDIYALGCVGYFLLIGRPPFIERPDYDHLHSPTPDFDCVDGRLKALILNMMRKLPDTRPSGPRVRAILNQVISNPVSGSNVEAISILAQVGARFATLEQKAQAELSERQAREVVRQSLFDSATEEILQNLARLREKIILSAPNVALDLHQDCPLSCALGGSYVVAHGFIPVKVDMKEFARCGWDVITGAIMAVFQSTPKYLWSASLWYAKLPGQPDYRWYETSYYTVGDREHYAPFSAPGYEDASLASSDRTHAVQIAFGPVACDDEAEEEFHHRWIYLFAMAADGKLRRPGTFPISWPP